MPGLPLCTISQGANCNTCAMILFGSLSLRVMHFVHYEFCVSVYIVILLNFILFSYVCTYMLLHFNTLRLLSP
jgi:hypothetical protein